MIFHEKGGSDMLTRHDTMATRWTAALTALLLATSASAQTDQGDPVRERGRTMTRALFAGEVQTIVNAMAPSALEAIGGSQDLQNLSQRLAPLGAESGSPEEAVYRERRIDHYYRIAAYEGAGDTRLTTHFAWNTNGRIVGLSVRPVPAELTTADSSQWPERELRLPFEGEWYVQWGGDLPHENYHVQAADQRFANDFLIVEDGRSHTGDGSRNGQYRCFGQPILAPADGRIERAVDGVADNAPGEMNREALFGNHVVIDHGDSVYSVLAHLRYNSLQVEEGQTVTAGERLGECGNSGHSSEAHLHYHLQDSPVPGEGQGIPAPFSDYRAHGDPVERDRPVRGDFIRPAQTPE
jgi:hypothetical protein